MRKIKAKTMCAIVALLLSMNALGQQKDAQIQYEPIMLNPSTLNCNAVSGLTSDPERWWADPEPEPLADCYITQQTDWEGTARPIGFFSKQTASTLWPYDEYIPGSTNWEELALTPIVQCSGRMPEGGPIPFHLQWQGTRDFEGNDCIRFIPGEGPVTINLTSLGAYCQLFFLGTYINKTEFGNPYSTLDVTVTYTDGSTLSGEIQIDQYLSGDDAEDRGAVRFGWYDGNRARGTAENEGACLWPAEFWSMDEPLSPTKLIKSITLQHKEGSSENEVVAIFAITGALSPRAPKEPFYVYSTSQSNPAQTIISLASHENIPDEDSFSYDVATDEDFLDRIVTNASLSGTKNGNQYFATISEDYSGKYIRVRVANEFGFSKATVATTLYEPLQNTPLVMTQSSLNHNAVAGLNDDLGSTKLDDYGGFYSSAVATNKSWEQNWIDKALQPSISIPSGIGGMDVSIPFKLQWEKDDDAADFDGIDCVRLTKDDNTAEISFEAPEAYSFLYMCGTAGNVPGGHVDVDVTISYIDGTSKSTTITYYDWYPGFTPANGKLFARHNGLSPEGHDGGPYIFALPINDALDALLPIKSINVESDENSDLVAGIFGFTGMRNGNAPKQPESAYAIPYNDYTIIVYVAEVTQDIAGNSINEDDISYYFDIAYDKDFTNLYQVNKQQNAYSKKNGECLFNLSVSDYPKAYNDLYFRVRAVTENGASASQTIKLYDQYKRDLTTGQYGTFCFNRTPHQILNGSNPVEFYTIAYYDEAANQIAIDPVEVEDIKAGVPYIIGTSVQWMYDPKSNPVEMSEEDQNGLHGTYTGISPTDFECHMLANTEDGPLFKKAAIGSSLPAYRAYLMLEEISTSPATPSKAGRRFIGMPNGTPTELICTKTNASAKKVFINNQFMIIKDGEKYNAQGIRMQ